MSTNARPGSAPTGAANRRPLDVVIVGGGIAGLATAYELHRRGHSFAILESRNRIGGVILSQSFEGFTLDAGPDSLLVQKPEAIALCRELGIGDRLVPTLPPRIAYIQRGGRLHPLPKGSVLGIPTRFGPFLRSPLFSWAAKLRMGAEIAIPARTDSADESIGAFMRRRFGSEAVTYLAEPLLAGIHAGDVDRLSLNALFPRLAEAERTHGSLIRAFRMRTSAPRSTDGAFRSLPGGLSELVEALERALPAAALWRDTMAVRVARVDDRFVVETRGGDRAEGRAVVFATPAYVTGRILHSLDKRLAALCEEVPYASTATIALAFDRDAVQHPLNGSGFVVPRAEGTGILAASFLSSKWPHRAPDGRVLLRTFAGGRRDPEACTLDDAELVRRSLDALSPLLGIHGAPLFTRVYRWERANAQHEVGHLDRMTAIEAALAGHPGLFITGSGFRGVGIPDCVADGRATAGQAVAYLGANDPVVSSTSSTR